MWLGRRLSKWVQQRKPPWLSDSSLVALLGQAVLALVVLYSVGGYLLGLRSPATESPPTLPFSLGAITVSLLALVATYGIFRDRRWAYLLELVVLWSIVIGAGVNGVHAPSIVLLPASIDAWAGPVLFWVALGLLSCHLAARALHPPEFGRPPTRQLGDPPSTATDISPR